MKKKLLLVCCTAALVLSACGGGSSSNNTTSSPETVEEKTEETGSEESETANTGLETNDSAESQNQGTDSISRWVVEQEKDAFGDVVENGEKYLTTTIKGTFSNTATASSDVTVQLLLLKNGDDNGVWLFFYLYEYGDNPVSPTSGDYYQMAVKYEDGAIDECDLETLQGDNAIAFIDHGRADGKRIYNCLCLGQDVKCIISSNTSKYNFTIESGNFAEACNEVGYSVYEDPSSVNTVESALRHLAAGEQWDYGNQITQVLLPLIDELDPMSTEEIEEAIKPGYWLGCNPAQTGESVAYIYNEDGTRENYVQLENHYYGYYSWKIEDDGLVIGNRGTDGEQDPEWGSPLPVRKIKDGWYLLGDNGGPIGVMVELNDELKPAHPLE